MKQWMLMGLLGVMGLLLLLIYAPLLVWMERVAVNRAQLGTGALLVVFTLVISVWDRLDWKKTKPNIHPDGVAYLALAFFCLWLAARWRFLQFPLVLISFSLTLTGFLIFIFGPLSARWFLPAMGGLLAFGLLAALFPALDWPLRAVAAQGSAQVLLYLGVKVELHLYSVQPPELVLFLHDRAFQVATECNGFGLLTSSVILAFILALQPALHWTRRVAVLSLAVPLALLCNALRIVSIALTAAHTDLPYKLIHEGLGTIFILAGLFLVWRIGARPIPACRPDDKEATAKTQGPAEGAG